MLKIEPRIASKDKEYKCWRITADQIPAAWDDLEELVERALAAGHGEMTKDDVYEGLCDNSLAAFVTVRGDRPELLLVAELVRYPQYKVIRIVLLAGKNTRAAMQYWPSFEDWAAAQGAIAIEGGGPPAQARLYQRLGFPTIYCNFRRSLKRLLV